MNFQEKLLKASAGWGARAADLTAPRLESLKSSLAVLGIAGRKLTQVARRHTTRFIRQNSTLATAARKDFASLALSTYATLRARPPRKKSRRAITTRRRAGNATA